MSNPADIFLSYNRDDQTVARRFAEGFEREGFTVWWDATLRSGEAYDQVTEQALRDAKAVVVLWSTKSVESRWVRAEATEADRNKTLVPVMIEPCKRPIMFELTHTAELSHWHGDDKDKAWQNLVSDVRRFVDKGHAVQPASAVDDRNTILAANPRKTKTLRRIGIAEILTLAAVIAVASFYAFTRSSHSPATPATTASAASIAPENTASTPATASVSLAVLPFANLSSDPEQEYFSDGLSDELINKLSQVKQLLVIGRNSSFYFKGRNEELGAIGKQLGVGHILQGSVRKVGKQLRVTAQLMDTNTGFNLWSNTYDRELTDVFSIQDQIASEVTKALSITLGVGEFDRKGMTKNVAAYDAYLKGLKILKDVGLAPKQALEQMQAAVKLDPDFALAWAQMANIYYLDLVASPADESKDIVQQLAAAANKAKQLAPQMPEIFSVDAARAAQQGDWLGADRQFRALLAQHGDAVAELDYNYGLFLKKAGKSSEAIPYLQKARRLDPLNMNVPVYLGLALVSLGRTDEAIAEVDRGLALGQATQFQFLHAIKTVAAYSAHDLDKAIALLEQNKPGQPEYDLALPLVRLLAAGKTGEVIQRLRAIDVHNVSPVTRAILTPLVAMTGDEALVERFLLAPSAELGWFWVGDGHNFWLSYMRPYYNQPAFKDVLRKSGLVAYLQATGWNDFCHPLANTENDFECK